MNKTFTFRPAIAALAAAALLATGCADMSQTNRDTAKGAGIGAGAGAILGGLTGGRSGAGTGAVVGGAVGAIAGNIWSKRMQEKQAAMERATQGTGIDVARTPNNELKVNIPSDFSFDVGSAAIKPAMRPVLDQFAQGLDPAMRVRVIGHTDSTGSDAVNDPLSRERAYSVQQYLTTRGVQGSRISTEGVGSRQPLADNATADGRARNRRVEIYLTDTQS
ncbi:MAG: OmpA family protein [Aquincola sp.]|uniref:OmpA family protein n=1 Tax=uncultured Aquincola sp. TaxID=886556 RepID=UPI0032B275BC|nr:OmpA family protein [Aquincola sp.]|tara:strand:- start:293 stop:952 length:660 start_codon:yes stop_codon:yes gene_type:complete